VKARETIKNKEMFLDEIVKFKIDELVRIKASPDFSKGLDGLKKDIEEAGPPRDFIGAIKGEGVRIIAEIKKASPSKGVLREDFNPVEIAGTYEKNGAVAISVLTEQHYFLGTLEHLKEVRRNVSLPVLRKDFILNPYHVYESRAAGADCILLIVGVLTGQILKEMIGLSRELGMAALVEVHTDEELSKALESGASLIGINNRDLKTFTTDINRTVELAGKVPPGLVKVSESGINTADDIALLKAAGVDAFLIGEALLRESDIAGKLKELLAALA
jgi:indole-3-glycerol phosphate synthase